jgi:hypothetical protein
LFKVYRAIDGIKLPVHMFMRHFVNRIYATDSPAARILFLFAPSFRNHSAFSPGM